MPENDVPFRRKFKKRKCRAQSVIETCFLLNDNFLVLFFLYSKSSKKIYYRLTILENELGPILIL